MNLFGSYRVGKLELKSRFVRSATGEGTADEDGVVTDTSVALYRNLGKGNIGLIITGHTFVSVHGYPGKYGAHNDDMIPGLRRLVQAVHEGGSKIALQISHSGTQTFMDNTIALAAIRCG